MDSGRGRAYWHCGLRKKAFRKSKISWEDRAPPLMLAMGLLAKNADRKSKMSWDVTRPWW